MLEVSERTIYRYLSQGRLREYVRGAKHGVRREDVDALLHPDEEELPLPLNRRTLTRMHHELGELRHYLDRCKAVLNMKWTPLDLPADALVARHRTAMLAVAEGFHRDSLPEWTDFLLRLRLDDLAAIEQSIRTPHPWIPFHALAQRLRPEVGDLHRAPSFELISAAKQNLDTLAQVWLFNKYGEEHVQRLLTRLIEEAQDQNSSSR